MRFSRHRVDAARHLGRTHPRLPISPVLPAALSGVRRVGEPPCACLAGGAPGFDGQPLSEELLAGARQGKENQVAPASQEVVVMGHRRQIQVQQDVEAHGEQRHHRDEDERHHHLPPFSEFLGAPFTTPSLSNARNTRIRGVQ